MRRAWLVLAATLTAALTLAAAADSEKPGDVGRFARMALECVHQEYPNKIHHVLNGAEDAAPPHELTPAFYGCYDWHSSVHGHWLLARAARLRPHADFANAARAALAESLTAENIRGEVAYIDTEGREGFERPYGIAWLLQLAAELREWDDPQAREWQRALAPLERLAAERVRSWLPKLTEPIRVGEHDQTAFAFGLILDWARTAGASDMVTLIRERSFDYYRADRNCPLGYEPSGHDFLSPCLAEADLMRRLLAPPEYAAWLGGFLPEIPHTADAGWLEPGRVTDRSDGKLVHLDGLNLSRAWMLEGMMAGLPEGDPRIAGLRAAAERHRKAALPAVADQEYEGGHWLGSFALYLVSERGLGES